MKRTKYHVRVMRPTFERAILTVDASSEQEATRLALESAERLTDKEWGLHEPKPEPPIVEVVVSEEEVDEPVEQIFTFLNDVQYAYALLRADLAESNGAFIVPTWLVAQSRLAIAEITQDWSAALSGIQAKGVEEFINWLARQTRPTNVVDFLAGRNKLRR